MSLDHATPAPFTAVRRANSSGCLSTVTAAQHTTYTVTGSGTSRALSTPGVDWRAASPSAYSHVSRGGETCPERSFSAPSLNSHLSVPEKSEGLRRKKNGSCGEKGRERKAKQRPEKTAMSLKDITPPLNACRLKPIRQPGSRSAVVSSLFSMSNTRTHVRTRVHACIAILCVVMVSLQTLCLGTGQYSRRRGGVLGVPSQ